MDELMNAIYDENRAKAVDHIKSMMSDKAFDQIDAQRETIAKQVFGAVVGADAEEEVEVESDDSDDEENTEELDQPEEEQTDETDNGDY